MSRVLVDLHINQYLFQALPANDFGTRQTGHKRCSCTVRYKMSRITTTDKCVLAWLSVASAFDFNTETGRIPAPP